MARAYVGTSGRVYPPWRGTFYPEGVKQKDFDNDEKDFAPRDARRFLANSREFTAEKPGPTTRKRAGKCRPIPIRLKWRVPAADKGLIHPRYRQ